MRRLVTDEQSEWLAATGRRRPRTPRSRTSRMLTRIALGLGLLLLTQADVAGAHPVLRRSIPAAAETLTIPPRLLRLSFSEPVELRFSKIQLIEAMGTTVALDPLATIPDSQGTIVATLDRRLGNGSYLVRWQVAGADAHVVRGEFRFVVNIPEQLRAEGDAGSVAPPDTPHEVHQPTATAGPPFDVSDPLFVGVRWLMYIALTGIVGAAVFQMAVLRRVELHWSRLGIAPRAGLTALCATVGHVAAVLLLVTLPLRLAAQSVAMHTPGQAFQADMIGGLIVHTTWGWAWAAQVILGVAAVILFRRAQTTGRWMPIRVVGLLLAFTPALSGHAIAAERWIPLAVLSDGLHIIGAAGWLGTLAVMLIVSITAALGPMEDHGALAAELVTAYSPVALGCAALAGLTGVASTWIHTGQLDLLWTTAYGRVLLLKLAILSVVVATGAYNWRRVLPSLGDQIGAVRVVRSASAEVMVAMLVLFVTAVLVALPTPLPTSGP